MAELTEECPVCHTKHKPKTEYAEPWDAWIFKHITFLMQSWIYASKPTHKNKED